MSKIDALVAKVDAFAARVDAVAKEYKKGDFIRENRQGAAREEVLEQRGTTIYTYGGKSYHVTKVVAA